MKHISTMRYLLPSVFLALLIVGILYFKDRGLLTAKDSMINQPLVNILGEKPNLPQGERAPNLVGIADWINTGPLGVDDLRGKVVLVDFWTYSCINCIRTLPHLNAWHQKYKDNGFVLLGVHTPEFAFEKKKENVLDAVKKYKIEYPVALDNDYATWNAYANHYWPAHYLIDKDGYIRYRTFGEGHYAETESAIQQLLLEAGLLSLDKISTVKEPPPATDFKQIGTPEIYLGYSRINNVGNMDQGVKPGEPFTFAEPKTIEDNRFYFVGPWKIEAEFAESLSPSTRHSEGAQATEESRGVARLIIRHKANKLNMVLAPASDAPIEIELKLDGQPLSENKKGADVVIKDNRATATIDSASLYNLTNTPDSDWHTLEITIPEPGLRSFTFTFG